jgi:hypothetical protein
LVYVVLAGGMTLTLYLWRTPANFELRFAIHSTRAISRPHLNDQDVLIAALPAVLIYGHVKQRIARNARRLRCAAYLHCWL